MNNESLAEASAVTHVKDVFEVQYSEIVVLIVLPDNTVLYLKEMNLVDFIICNPFVLGVLGYQKHLATT